MTALVNNLSGWLPPRCQRPGFVAAMVDLLAEAERATAMLAVEEVRQVWRPGIGEIGIEFADGTRLFVDRSAQALAVSITAGRAGDG